MPASSLLMFAAQIQVRGCSGSGRGVRLPAILRDELAKRYPDMNDCVITEVLALPATTDKRGMKRECSGYKWISGEIDRRNDLINRFQRVGADLRGSPKKELGPWPEIGVHMCSGTMGPTQSPP
jgi:hypothetical protein